MVIIYLLILSIAVGVPVVSLINKIVEKGKLNDENPDLINIINKSINKEGEKEFIKYLLKIRGNKDWGKLIAFNGQVDGKTNSFAFFDKGVYFKGSHSEIEIFVPKNKILNIEFSKVQVPDVQIPGVDMQRYNKYTYKELEVKYENGLIKTMGIDNEFWKAISERIKVWSGDILSNNATLVKRYNLFIEQLERIKKSYNIVSFPIKVNNINLSEYFNSININIVLGVDPKNKIGIFVADETLFEIDYDDFIGYNKEGIRYVDSEVYVYKEGKEGDWDGKRIAAGLVLAGPVGAALIGKSKTTAPTYRTRTEVKDSRQLVIKTAKVKSIYRLNKDFEYVKSTENYIAYSHSGFYYNNNEFVLPFEFYDILEAYCPEKLFKEEYEI